MPPKAPSCDDEVPPRGVVQPLNSSGKTGLLTSECVNSYAVGHELLLNDPELGKIAKAWPDLHPAIKAGILAMVEGS